jgi:hypothetical protein
MEKDVKDILNKKETSTSSFKNTESFFYSVPDSKLLTIFIVVMVLIVIVMLVVFKCFMKSTSIDSNDNGMITAYLSLVGVPVGVTIAFVVTNVWANFASAQSKIAEEATQLALLYSMIGKYPTKESRSIQKGIKLYTRFIIEKEFDLMSKGIQSSIAFEALEEIGNSIYSLNPLTNKEISIYNQAINLYQKTVSLRIARMGYVSFGIPLELWWVLILGVIIVVIMTFFINFKCFWLHITVTSFAIAAIVSLIFLIVALDYPFRGDFGLSSSAFSAALSKMK